MLNDMLQLLVGLDATSFMRTGVQVVVQGHHGPLCARVHHLFLASPTAACSLRWCSCSCTVLRCD